MVGQGKDTLICVDALLDRFYGGDSMSPDETDFMEALASLDVDLASPTRGLEAYITRFLENLPVP
jgi:hypothetical protein